MTQRRIGMTLARFAVLARLDEKQGPVPLREAQCSPKQAIALRELGWVDLQIERREKAVAHATYPTLVVWPTIVGLEITTEGRAAFRGASF